MPIEMITYTSGNGTSTLDDMTESESWKKHTTVIRDEEFIYGLRHSPTGLAFSPDGRRLASISRTRDWKAGLWDVDSGEQIAELPFDTVVKTPDISWIRYWDSIFTAWRHNRRWYVG